MRDGVQELFSRKARSCGAVWSARHPVKVEAAGSNPVRTASSRGPGSYDRSGPFVVSIEEEAVVMRPRAEVARTGPDVAPFTSRVLQAASSAHVTGVTQFVAEPRRSGALRGAKNLICAMALHPRRRHTGRQKGRVGSGESDATWRPLMWRRGPEGARGLAGLGVPVRHPVWGCQLSPRCCGMPASSARTSASRYRR